MEACWEKVAIVTVEAGSLPIPQERFDLFRNRAR